MSLDTPIWSALTSRHAALAVGSARALRYPAEISPFCATPDTSADSLAALARLARPGETLLTAQAAPIRVPEGMHASFVAEIVQMVPAAEIAACDDPRIVALGRDDAAEMLALATLCNPGPFSLRAQDLGNFWGIRDGKRLVAMAGERMKLPGHVEVSGVATHPDFRGRGFGALLSRFVAGKIAAAGETPFLHALADNTAAISVYRSIGFHIRRELQFAALSRDPA